MTGTVTLYTYWRSQAAFRVRIALRLKGIANEKITLDLLKGDQFAASYQALNPEGVVPTLIDGAGEPLVQSLAILEYLDEKYPDPPLLPTELRARAHARAIAQMVAMDAHPFIVPRVRKYLEEELGLDEATRAQMGAPLARCGQPRGRAGARQGPAHRALLRRRSADHRGHLPGGAPDQRQAVRRARARGLSDRGPHLRQLHGSSRRSPPSTRCASRTRRRNSIPARKRHRAHARRDSARRRLSGAPGRRGSALRDRADVQADRRRVRLGARRARARGRALHGGLGVRDLPCRAVWPTA